MIISENTIEFQVWEWCNYYVIGGRSRGDCLYIQKDGTVSSKKSMECADGTKVCDPEWCYENTLGYWGDRDEAEKFLKEWNKHHRVKRTDSVELIYS